MKTQFKIWFAEDFVCGILGNSTLRAAIQKTDFTQSLPNVFPKNVRDSSLFFRFFLLLLANFFQVAN